MIPQLIIFGLGMISLGVNISRHGEIKKESKHNGWISLMATMIMWYTLYHGGFWNVIL